MDRRRYNQLTPEARAAAVKSRKAAAARTYAMVRPIILELQANGHTFEEIAVHLRTEGIVAPWTGRWSSNSLRKLVNGDLERPAPPRHRRPPNKQFAARISPDVHAAIYRLSAELNISLGDVLERAVAALQSERARGG